VPAGSFSDPKAASRKQTQNVRKEIYNKRKEKKKKKKKRAEQKERRERDEVKEERRGLSRTVNDKIGEDRHRNTGNPIEIVHKQKKQNSLV